MIDVLYENNAFVDEMRKALRHEAGLAEFPGLLKAVIRDNRWRIRRIKTGEEAPFDRFEDFITTPPLKGLGATMDLIRRVCGGDAEALDLIDKATQREPHRKIGDVDNINITARPDGTSAARALRKLRKDRSDLHDRVLAGEISPHAAMVEAGFRDRTFIIPDDPDKAARRLLRHFQGDRLVRLIDALEKGVEGS